MVSTCPKCGTTIPDDSVYCPYCGRGLKPSAKSSQVSVAGAFMIVTSVASLIFLLLSIQALLNIYTWYPPLVAQSWFSYNQAFTGFSFTGFLFGLLAASFSLARISYRWTMLFAVLCTLSASGASIISTVIPHSNAVQSFLYYFLPLITPSLVGTILIFPRRAEFKS